MVKCKQVAPPVIRLAARQAAASWAVLRRCQLWRRARNEFSVAWELSLPRCHHACPWSLSRSQSRPGVVNVMLGRDTPGYEPTRPWAVTFGRGVTFAYVTSSRTAIRWIAFAMLLAGRPEHSLSRPRRALRASICKIYINDPSYLSY